MSRIIPIDNLTLPQLELYASTSEVRLRRYYEPRPGLFVAESAKVIRRALDAGYVPVSLLAETRLLEGEVRDIIERCGEIPVYVAENEVLSGITGYRLTGGILSVMHRRPLPSLAEVCDGAARIAVLENVTNPTNVGAIFRSAAALNFDAVVLTPACSDPFYRRAARVSMGTVFQIPWTYFDKASSPGRESVFVKPGSLEEPETVEETGYFGGAKAEHVTILKELGFTTVAMALREDSVAIDDPALVAREKLAVFLGNEEEGLKDASIHACDYAVRIPMFRGVDSLNVAAASAVAFWQLRK